MFCRYCGSKLDDNAVVCPNCGVPVDNRFGGYQQPPYQYQPQYPPQYPPQSSNPFALVGFILSFFMPVVGLILSIIGYNKAKKEFLPNQGLALAGIIISALYIAFAVFIFFIFIAALMSIPVSYPNYY